MIKDGLKYAVIGSGSSANAYIFEYNDFSIIIDNGFSCKKCMDRALSLGFDTSKVKYIFLTHNHSDHFKGIEVLSRKLKAPVVVHEKLNLNRKLKGHLYKRLNILPGQIYEEDNIKFQAFETSHDADFSISYHFELGGVVFTIISDTGIVSHEMLNLASRSDVLFLEANYNEEMLFNGPYEPWLKDRISSELGHLSNRAAMQFLNEAGDKEGSRIKEVYFCHLSSTNNTEEVLKRDINDYLIWNGQWVICPKGEPVACN
ncbi:MAG: MBL fold metallo-hydrolase [Spirochaetales bacterium]|nr:MBL fold metallo-hydrolase [Spirochaetales bacterium]